MGRPQDDDEYIEPFSRRLGRILDKRNFTQTALARESEVPRSYITDMKQGDRTRLTPTPVLKCIKGLIRLNEITTSDEVNEWLYSWANEIGSKYIPVEELGFEGEELLELLNQVQEQEQANQVTVLAEQEYFTRQGIPLIGRKKDIAEILTKLQDKRTRRFLTLTGAPGVGKSELGRCIKDIAPSQGYTNVRFLSLEAVYDVDGMMKAINEELRGVDLQQRTLLILDNCEQIKDIDYTSEEIYALVEKNPQLIILATSRVNISEGKSHEVKALALPPASFEHESLENLQKFGAVQLFLEGIYCWYGKEKYQQDIEKNRALLLKICDLLDGLPIALLIASALIEQKGSLQLLHESLFDMSIQGLRGKNRKPKYHVTLDDLISHSYKILGEKEQTLLRWIAAFPSVCTQVAITQICSMGKLFGYAAVSSEKLYSINEGAENLLTTLRNHYLITYHHLFTEEMVIAIHNTVKRFGRRMLNKARPYEGYEEGEETKQVLSLLMDFNSFKRWEMYIKRLYNPQRLLDDAKRSQFLENGDEDEETIKGELDKLLISNTNNIAYYKYLPPSLLDDIDCFRKRNYLYPAFLDLVTKTYLHHTHFHIMENPDQAFIRVNPTTLTADERRQAFLKIFDDCYRTNLFTLVASEGIDFVRSLLETYDSRYLWEYWDKETKFLIGLSSPDIYTIGMPGKKDVGDSKYQYFMFL